MNGIVLYHFKPVEILFLRKLWRSLVPLVIGFPLCLFVKMGISGEFSPWLISLVISTHQTHTHTHTPSSRLPWRCCDREKEFGHLQPPAMSFRQEICPLWSLSLYICTSSEPHFSSLSPFLAQFSFPRTCRQRANLTLDVIWMYSGAEAQLLMHSSWLSAVWDEMVCSSPPLKCLMTGARGDSEIKQIGKGYLMSLSPLSFCIFTSSQLISIKIFLSV